ncbi:uncharacterized protein KRP23_1209 [Phytophthora ramorum]|uniref:uncharacterized protein n=1 Tax=Phytophthora ramorum TaxID=164328 RepID=UPI0030B347D3|nr:hypothetical protein KRP23_1209 [Phytophthora ramorum]
MKRVAQVSETHYESQCQGREGDRQEGTDNTEPTSEVATKNKLAKDTRVVDKKTTEAKKVANGITRSRAEPTRDGSDVAMDDVENRGTASSSVTHHEVRQKQRSEPAQPGLVRTDGARGSLIYSDGTDNREETNEHSSRSEKMDEKPDESDGTPQ